LISLKWIKEKQGDWQNQLSSGMLMVPETLQEKSHMKQESNIKLEIKISTNGFLS